MATEAKNPQHRLQPASPTLPCMRWKCSCGGWQGDVPNVGPYGRTSWRARIAQVIMAHGKHVRYAKPTTTEDT